MVTDCWVVCCFHSPWCCVSYCRSYKDDLYTR